MLRPTANRGQARGVDTIAEFNRLEGDFVLVTSIFPAIGAKLTADDFVLRAAALDSNDFILYNSSRSSLFRIADGNGAWLAVQGANVLGNPQMTVADFFIA